MDMPCFLCQYRFEACFGAHIHYQVVQISCLQFREHHHRLVSQRLHLYRVLSGERMVRRQKHQHVFVAKRQGPKTCRKRRAQKSNVEPMLLQRFYLLGGHHLVQRQFDSRKACAESRNQIRHQPITHHTVVANRERAGFAKLK